MSIAAPNVAVVFGAVLPPQGDFVSLQVHLGCSSEVGSFDAVLANFDGRYSPNGAYPISVGADGSISVGRGVNCPLLMTCRVENVKYKSTATQSYVQVSGRCWGERLFRRVVTKTYAYQKGEDIVKNLLDYYVGLSHDRGGAELVENTDTSYISLVYENAPVFEVLKYIAQSADHQGTIGYDFRIAPDGKFEFFPKNSKPNFTNLNECIEQSEYRQDVSRVRNKITVYGAADKSHPTAKDEWTETLNPTDGLWTATSGIISSDASTKVLGAGSIKTYAETLQYAGSIFTLDTGKLVDAQAYPALNFWLNQDISFNGNVTVTLFDGVGRTATHEVNVGTGKWFKVQVGTGVENADLWQVQSWFDWSQIWRIRFTCWFDEASTGSFWVDGLFFGGRRYEATAQDAASQASFGLREQVEVNEELWSDAECQGRAQALLTNLKDPAQSLTLKSTVIDYATTPILAGDTVHVTLPVENVDDDFRVLSAEYYIDANTQTLETTLELGKEAPMLADYVYALKSKTDSLSRYKTAGR
ncbi:MAG: hypothetical protein NWF04_06260 [Candidatus Bathyarchaeota archaeon]|nr:hypothetical protein [Candidatus Bathyarchaeota archaeon]